MDDEIRIKVSCEQDTEVFLNWIFSRMADADLDSIEVDKEVESFGVAREPITTAAVLTLTGAIFMKVIPLIERWLETKRQEKVLKIVAEALQSDSEAGKVLADLDARHTNAMVSYRTPLTR